MIYSPWDWQETVNSFSKQLGHSTSADRTLQLTQKIWTAVHGSNTQDYADEAFIHMMLLTWGWNACHLENTFNIIENMSHYNKNIGRKIVIWEKYLAYMTQKVNTHVIFLSRLHQSLVHCNHFDFVFGSPFYGSIFGECRGQKNTTWTVGRKRNCLSILRVALEKL